MNIFASTYYFPGSLYVVLSRAMKICFIFRIEVFQLLAERHNKGDVLPALRYALKKTQADQSKGVYSLDSYESSLADG